MSLIVHLFYTLDMLNDELLWDLSQTFEFDYIYSCLFSWLFCFQFCQQQKVKAVMNSSFLISIKSHVWIRINPTLKLLKWVTLETA